MDSMVVRCLEDERVWKWARWLRGVWKVDGMGVDGEKLIEERR